TISLIISFIALAWFGDFNVIHAARAQPLMAMVYLLLYFFIGVAWSIGKWWFYLRERAEKYFEYGVEFLKLKNLPPNAAWTPELQAEFFNGSRDSVTGSIIPRRHGLYVYREASRRPKASENKARIIMWMSY